MRLVVATALVRLGFAGARAPAVAQDPCGGRAGHRIVLQAPEVVVWEEVTERKPDPDPLTWSSTTVTRACRLSSGPLHELGTTDSSAKSSASLTRFTAAGTRIAYVYGESYYGSAYEAVRTLDVATGEAWSAGLPSRSFAHAVDVNRAGDVAWARDGWSRGRVAIRLIVRRAGVVTDCGTAPGAAKLAYHRRITRLQIGSRYLRWRSGRKLHRRALADC